jgi:ankyrin repeat protein
VRPTPAKVTTIAKLLIDRGADVNQHSGGAKNTPLMLALWNCSPSVSLLLLDSGADPKLENGFGHDAVFSAVTYAAGVGGDGYEALIKKGLFLTREQGDALKEAYKDKPEALKVITRMCR